MLGVETEVETTLERRSKQPQPPTESSAHPLWEISEPLRKNVWSWPWPDCGDCQAVPWCLLLKSLSPHVLHAKELNGHYQRNREKFHHSWLENKTISFCQQTAMFWLVYIEREGFFAFCVKSTKHQIIRTKRLSSL